MLVVLRYVLFALALTGCSSVSLESKRDQPLPPPQFDRVEVTVSLDPFGIPVQPPIKGIVTEKSYVEELASYFPEMGRGKTGKPPGGWDVAAELVFIDKAGNRVKIVVDYKYQTWSEGRGDWRIERYDPGLFVSIAKALRIQ